MPTATVIGSTGLVGSHILTQLLAHPSITHTTTLTRRAPAPAESTPTLTPLITTDTDTWPSLVPATTHLFSALGTTRAAAGSVAAQYAIDYTLNLSLATAAKERGVKTYVLISSTGANANSWAPYAAMKGKLEDEVTKLGFERTVILRPGLILGQREEGRLFESVAQGIARRLGGWGEGFALGADGIARAAVRAGVDGVRGADGEKEKELNVWVLGHKEIVELSKN